MRLENWPNSASTSTAFTKRKGKALLIYTKSSSSDAIRSVSFLPHNCFLLATTRVVDLTKDATLEGIGNCPVLVVYDLSQVSTSQHEGVSSPIAVFSLNVMDDLQFVNTLAPYWLQSVFDPGEMELYYRFGIHSYSDEVAVPFFSSSAEQLIALQTNGLRRRCHVEADSPGDTPRLCRILLIPISKFMSHIDGAAADNMPVRYIPWNDWGATGTGWAPDPHILRCLRGSHQVSSSRIIPGHKTTGFVDVWDFSRARVAQHEPQSYRRNILPCVRTQVALPIHLSEEGYRPWAITEDAIICRVRGFNLGPIASLIIYHCDAISTRGGSKHISSFSRVLP